MRRPRPVDLRRAATLAVASVVACGGATRSADTGAQCEAAQAPAGTRVLVFTRTTGYRHESIPAGADAVRDLGRAHGFAVEQTEDPTVFTDSRLARFAVVVFLSTTGDVLDASQQPALEHFVQGGGGFVGVHSAADTEYDWPWYGRLVGAWFRTHPPVQSATVRVLDAAHPSTRCLPAEWRRTDEWYDFSAPPADGSTVLAEVDESTYEGGGTGARHPISWARRVDGGRAWYTAMGHTVASWAEPDFRRHLAGGIVWAATR